MARRPSSSPVRGRQPSSLAARALSIAIRWTSPGRAGAISGSNSRSQTLASRLAELEHARLDAGADVVGAPGLRPGPGQERLDDVADVHVVARLVPVAEHPRGASAQKRSAEDGHHPRLSERVLPRPVDVAQPQGDPRDVVEPPVQRHVALRRVLALPVVGVRPAFGLLVERELAS